MRTTLPRRSSGVNGGELSHPVAPASEGSWPSTGKEMACGAVCCIGVFSLIVEGSAAAAPLACRPAQASRPSGATASVASDAARKRRRVWLVFPVMAPSDWRRVDAVGAAWEAGTAPCPHPTPRRLAQRSERRPHLFGEALRLLPGQEVPALSDPVVVDEVRIGAPGPALR